MSKPHTKLHKVTASDVARLAGVSKWTVSRAFTPGASISEQAREKVLKIAETLGYRPNLLARSLSQKKTQIIGVVIDELKNPHSMLMLDTVTHQLQQRGYMALLLNIGSGDNYSSVMLLADQLQIDGLLFLGTVLTDDLVRVAKETHKVPLVQVCRNNDEPDIDVVNIDGLRAGKKIGELLLAQGCTRIGYMMGPETSSHHTQRLDGLKLALNEAGLDLDVLLCTGVYSRERSYEVMSEYLNTQAPHLLMDALFCENDILALGALAALRDRASDHVISVVGFDDIEEASLPTWQLTTFSQRIDLIITEALNRLIDGKATPDGVWSQGELRIRRSHLRLFDEKQGTHKK
ncbi:LacI family DNA-binding transcriptional regulator [Pantoea piersonii]|uniref:LacI family DNA-binding transcriptional regulator n=1 Tax=Pantoea piersonii TaxID=2364647 RepID=UPI0022F14D08|nr:LacI family DNA-binding transcriptional regulator [Pantoea piersonii]WBV24139.1 LacI family DNA-binding transcriptional regulator [Pantoea piersonii]